MILELTDAEYRMVASALNARFHSAMQMQEFTMQKHSRKRDGSEYTRTDIQQGHDYCDALERLMRKVTAAAEPRPSPTKESGHE